MKKIQKGLQFKSLVSRNMYGLYLHEYQAYELLKKYKLPLVPVICSLLFRVLELVLQKMLMLSLRELCPVQLKINFLLMLS